MCSQPCLPADYSVQRGAGPELKPSLAAVTQPDVYANVGGRLRGELWTWNVNFHRSMKFHQVMALSVSLNQMNGR